MAFNLRRLHPGPSEPVTVADAYSTTRRPPSGRPWVGLCMIASLDGAIAIEGASAGLGNRNDIDVLLGLRALADVIVVGAGTASGEGYGPPSKPGQRIGVVTNSGKVDLTNDLFTSAAGFLIAPHAAQIDEAACEVLRVGEQRVDLQEAIQRIDTIVPGVAYVQAEGGPTLNAALLAADLVDELDLTISPRVVGTDGPRLTNGEALIDARFSLDQLLMDDEGFVFGRWLRARPRS